MPAALCRRRSVGPKRKLSLCRSQRRRGLTRSAGHSRFAHAPRVHWRPRGRTRSRREGWDTTPSLDSLVAPRPHWPIPAARKAFAPGRSSVRRVIGLFALVASFSLGVTVSTAFAQPQPGLVSEWQGNGTANDSVGTSNGTLVDGGYAPGQNGQQAFNLDGQDDYVSIPGSAMTNVTSAISVSAWVKPTSSGELDIFSQYDTHDTATSFDFGLTSTDQVTFGVNGPSCDWLGGGDQRLVETTASIRLGQWSQVAGTFDAATQQLHILINGQAVATQMIYSGTVSRICSTGSPVRIGAFEPLQGGLSGFFNGEIQDVQLYNRDLTTLPSGVSVITGGVSSSVSNLDGQAGGVLYPTQQVGHATFSGSIVPASAPGAPAPESYWFEYWRQGQAGPGYYQTKHQPYTFAGPGVSASDTGSITPYRPWFYRLDVQDTTGNVIYGSVKAFVPGNRLNPADFTMNGRWVLTIVCSDPCNVLTPPGATFLRSGTAFGQFDAKGFDGSTGAFGGDGQLKPDTGDFNTNFENSFDITSASTGLETTTLTVQPTGAGGQTPLSPFTLDGIVEDYGGPYHEHGKRDYEPTMSGTVRGGGVWSACHENQNCIPPENGNKQIARTLNDGISYGSVATIGLELNPAVAGAITLAGAITTAIADDPADRQIHKAARPLKIERITVNPGNGLSARAAKATSKMLNALMRAGAVGQAFLDAIQRYQGAAAAGNPQALFQQFQATLKYGHQFATRLRAAAKVLSAQRRTIENSPLGRKHLSRPALSRSLRSIRRHGLPRALIKELKHLGLNDAEIRGFSKRLPIRLPSGPITPLGTLLRPAFARQLLSLASGLDKYLTGLQQKPLG